MSGTIAARISLALAITVTTLLTGCGSSPSSTTPYAPPAIHSDVERSPAARRLVSDNDRSSRATVTGRTSEADGSPLPGVLVQFYVLPRLHGDVFKVNSNSNGTYAINLPDGFYRVFATYYQSDEPGDSVDLVTGDGEIAVEIEVPPPTRIDFAIP